MRTKASRPFTGSDHDGTGGSDHERSIALGSERTFLAIAILNGDQGGPLASDHSPKGHPDNLRPFYALSQVFLVAFTDLTAKFKAGTKGFSHVGSTLPFFCPILQF